MLGGNGILVHTLTRPNGLMETQSVLDIGAGVRPFSWWKPEKHLCVEPYELYCRVLWDADFWCYCGTAEVALKELRADTVLLLDVIEHMGKEEAARVIALAKRAAGKQIVIYTPLGFMAQDADAWGYGGDVWQTHRSGWMPEEFPGWTIERGSKAFFALWNA